MNLFLAVLALAGGLAVLIVGADLLVRGSVRLARSLGLSAFAIGVTVVAFGTSAPEMFASVGAAVQNVPDLAIGNVVGSNIANILFILGVGALVAPMAVHGRVRLIEVPLMLVITVGASQLMVDQELGRVEGGLLFLGLVGYVIFIVKSHRVGIEHKDDEGEGEEAGGGEEKGSGWVSVRGDVLVIVIGVLALGLGAKALVFGASDLALRVGVPTGVVGTTVVALGTSLPELAATVRAAMAKSTGIAVGNVVGSNVFNLLSVLGVTALVRPLHMPESMIVHVWAMLAVSALLVLVVLLRPVLGRGIGLLFVALYVAYITMSFVG